MYKVKLPRLEEWQQPVFDDFKDGLFPIQCIKAKRQVGKSIIAEVCVLYKSFDKDGAISVIVEPTLSQCRRVFKQILKAIGGETSPIIKSANATLLELEFNNGSSIILRSAEQKENLRGLTVTGVLVIDEAAFIPDDIFDILYPIVDANNSPVIIISTPLFLSGEFYEKYIEGIGGLSPIVKSYNWSEYDTSKYLPKEKLEYYRNHISPLRFKSEYEGEFIEQGSYVMGDVMSVVGDYEPGVPLYGGLDWGNGGENDYSVLILIDASGKISSIHAKNNLSPTSQIDYFSSVINGLNLRCVEVEMNSIGTVYKDMLQQRTSTYIHEFVTSNESKRRIIEQLITAIQNKLIEIPNDPELIRELQHYNVEKTKTGYTYNGVGAHDDYVMALAFAYDAYVNIGGGFTITFA